MGVSLRAATEADVATIVALAAADACPVEVMPPDQDPEPERWTAPRLEAYAAFLTTHLRVLGDGRRETSFVVEAGGHPVGVARLLPDAVDGSAAEVGLWLGRAARGYGYATAVLEVLVARARAAGFATLVADTLVDNAPALAALRRAGAALARRDDGEVVDGVVDLRPGRLPEGQQ